MFGRLLLLGILFHVVFLKSIFDIYFVTPLIHGMKQYSAGEAPAKRLFLIVGDGLRPDKLLQPHSEKVIGEGQTYAAPFLRSIIQNNGTFGVSHTRVPTESRPGHVALIAGFYEDVSAVTKGWKKNPVNFDSVFNQSRHTYSFGSEDILPMFSEGASDPSRVDTFMYSSELEDFSSNGIVLDEWVFDRLDELLAQSLEDKELWDMLHQDKIVFFLHLLGIDTIGHNKHPDSVEYVENIQYIDGKIQELVDKMNNYYNNDGASSWVFTADHGMSDFGSHGDGNLDNTRTPIIAWGAGIQSPTHEKNYGHDEYSLPWNLTEIKRIDIQQADIAALMSYLVGLNFPVNSVGQIPLDYLDCSSRRKAEVALMNALEIGEQYNLKSASKDQTSIFFRPYSPLRNYTEVQASFYNSVIADIESGEYESAIEHCFHFSQTVLSGLRYLQRYDWLLLRSIVFFGYLSWIGYVICFVFSLNIEPSSKIVKPVSVVKRVAFNIPFLLICIFFYIQSSPPFYYGYALFPTIFLQLIHSIFPNTKLGFKNFLTVAKQKHGFSLLKILFISLCILCLLQFIVYSYFHREGFSVILMGLAAWPWLLHADYAFSHKTISVSWSVLTSLLCFFTILPVNKKESLLFIFAGGFAMSVAGVFYILYRRNQAFQYSSTVTNKQLVLQVLIIMATVPVTLKIADSLQRNIAIPPILRLVAFGLFITSYIIPSHHIRSCKHYFLDRLAILFLTFSPTMCMLSISFEALFYVVLFITLGLWMELETELQKYTEQLHPEYSRKKDAKFHLSLSHIRISLFFYIFINVAFFGTGNVASLSTFALDSVKRFIPVFNPVTQGALLMYTILVPFIALSAAFGIMNKRLGGIQQVTFFLAVGMADIVTINFFYLVKDEGSWKDIGVSISHFCISNFLILFITALEHASAILCKNITDRKSVV